MLFKTVHPLVCRKITKCNKWPLEHVSDFIGWQFKLSNDTIYLYTNNPGLIYFMNIDLNNFSIHFKGEFRHDSAKKMVAQVSGRQFLLFARRICTFWEPKELELYSTNDLNKSPKVYKDIPNGQNVKECIQLNSHSIYILYFEREGLLKKLVIIDIESDKRTHISLDVELFSMGIRFVSYKF